MDSRHPALQAAVAQSLLSIRYALTGATRYLDAIHEVPADLATWRFQVELAARARRIREEVRREIAGKFAAFMFQRFELGDCYQGAPFDHRAMYTQDARGWTMPSADSIIIGLAPARPGADQDARVTIMKPRA